MIGWTAAPFEGSPTPYTAFSRKGGVSVAGLMKTPEGMHFPPFWSMYIAVPNFADAVAHIKRLGGSELSPVIDIPTVGRMQMLKDPQGAAFYIIQPGSSEERPEGAPEIGQGSWHELMTTDAEAAMKFYSEVFGWQPSESMDMGEMGKYQMFNRPHGMIGGMMNKPPRWPTCRRTGASTSWSRRSTPRSSASRPTAARSSMGRWKCRAATGSSTPWIRKGPPSRSTRRSSDLTCVAGGYGGNGFTTE